MPGACAKQQILFRVQDLTVVIVPKITIWNPVHGIILFVFVSFDVRLITPPSYPGSLTAQSFPIRRISSWRALVSGVFGHCTSSWWITFGCWSTKAISSSISRRKALSFASYSKASDPFCVMPTLYVSYSPIDVSPLDSGVLSSANPSVSGKGGLIVETAVYCIMAVDFALAAFRLDTGFLAGGTVRTWWWRHHDRLRGRRCWFQRSHDCSQHIKYLLGWRMAQIKARSS